MKNLILLLALSSLVLAGCAQRKAADGNAALMKRFQQADVSGDGKVSRDEFVDLMITEAFANYDRTGKGYVTVEEYVAGGGTPAGYRKIDRRGLGKVTLADAKASKLVRDQMAIPFDQADANNSGYVTFEEFVAYRKQAAEFTR